jgi:hypothetical protein
MVRLMHDAEVKRLLASKPEDEVASIIERTTAVGPTEALQIIALAKGARLSETVDDFIESGETGTVPNG